MCDTDETEQEACIVQEPWPQWDPHDISETTTNPWDSSVLEETDGETETDFSQTFQITKAYEVLS